MPKITIEAEQSVINSLVGSHFNKLTPAQAERLAVLSEELAEASHRVAKILRHGYESVNPFHPHSGNNQTLLQDELGHVQNSIAMLIKAGDLSESAIQAQQHHKASSIGSYLHHQEKQ